MSYKTEPLSQVATVIDSLHKTPKYDDNGTHYMARATDVKYGYLNLSNMLKVNTDVYNDFTKRYKPSNGDIIITRVGSYGNTSFVKNTNFCLGQNTAAIVPNINNKYLFYMLNSRNIRHQIESYVVGTTQKTLSLKAINSILIPRFHEETEQKIAHILSTLDDKIELNRKMNQTLEEMAQALFKSWFVDFDPVHAKTDAKSDEALEGAATELGMSQEVLELFPGEFEESEMGMIPKGWKVSTIEDEVTIYGGATPSTKEDKYWVGGDNHWATPRDLSGLNSKVLIATGRKITDAGVNKISSKQLPIGTILLSSRAPVGYIAYSTVPISINQGFIAMVCKKKLSNHFIMYWLDVAMNEIKNRATGTTFSEISKSAFRPIKLVVANNEVITAFDTIVAPMVNKIIANEYEIETLTKTRDTLLPRLLSGELDVSNMEVE